MMKKMQWVDLLREIRKSKGRYFSLLFIVALGTAFYAGVRSSEPDMTASADCYYDETNLMDIRVLGTLGLTEEDLEAIADTEGIQSAEGGYSAELFAVCADSQPILNVVSTCEKMNDMTIVEGRMPDRPDECFLDQVLMEREGYQIGDTITLIDAEGNQPDNLKGNTFTIVGYGNWSWFLSISRGSASIGSGKVDAFMALHPSAFDMDCYTIIYTLVEDANQYNTFSDAYKDAVKLVTDRLEELADGQCEIRYDSIYTEAQGKLDEARQEVADARQELADGKQELTDGEVQYEEGKAQYQDGLKQYQDGAAAFADGENQLAASRKELDSGKKQYQDGLKAYTEGKQQLEAGKKQAEEGEQQLAAARKQLEAGQTELQSQKQQLDEKNKQVEAGVKALEDGKKQIQDAEEEVSRSEKMLIVLRAAYDQALQVYEEAEEAENRIDKEKNPELWEAAHAALLKAKAKLDEYDEKLKEAEKQLADGKAELETAKQELETQETQLAEAQKQIADGYAQLEAAQKELDAGLLEVDQKEKELNQAKQEILIGELELKISQLELNSAKTQLDSGEAAYQSGADQLESSRKELTDSKTQLDQAKQELIDARAELDEGWKEYEDAVKEAEPKLADAEKEIADGEKELESLETGKWYVLGRDTIQNSVEYGMDTERIGAIGKVFPAIFFLVAALVSLTTMTRMIEEERMMIGTMKALGYSKFSIASKYIVYALSATLAGGILGVVVGSKILPYVIMSAYGMLYSNVHYMLIPLHPSLCISSIGIAVFCTVGAAFAACYKELLSTPASLMRPPAPKQGKRVIFEYLPFLWKRLNFSMKSTIRNLIRYKKRFFMTVFGIGGCMAVLLVSFGLHDSIAEIVNNQYKNIWTYSASGAIDDKLTFEEQKTHAEELLAEEKDITDALFARLTSIDASSEKGEKTVNLFTVEDPVRMESYLKLHDRVTKEPFTLTDEGVIITEKLAYTLDVSEGDTLTLKLDDTTFRDVKITAIAENYMMHYVYITPELYRELYGEMPEFNQIYLQFAENTDSDEEKTLAESILGNEMVNSVSLVTELQATVDDMMNALNLVVWVLIIAAGLLVFVVLFNLNNINISERRRELASLKVLGFYDPEVAMYVYRENIFLTLFGIIAGVFMGTWLHRYTILTLEVDMIMFGRNISMASYLYSSLFTVIFSILVNLGMYYKLKQIDMVESLKSVE